MKKCFKLTALLLAATILFSSCIGSFRLTNNIKDWNEGVSNSKFVNELIFVALHIVPAYPLAIFADALVLNSIEFWTGKSALAEAGETKTVKNSQGEEVQVTTTENGYTLTNGEEAVNLVYNEEEQTWSAQQENQTTNLIKLNGDNTADLYVGDEVVEVTLDAQGINMAYIMANNGFASNN